jgi:DNA-binding NarL/FixJ family response regulator
VKHYKIALADDHVMLRDGIKNIIEASEGLAVVGEASDGLMLLNILKRTPLDMVILDISMPKLRGIETAQEIRRQFPEVAILILSMHKSREYLRKVLASGVRGYVLKEESGSELIHAIETIRRGGSYLSPMLMAELAEDPIGICRGQGLFSEDALTTRERQVLQLIADGKTSKEIAKLLYISIHTVHNHRKNIKRKLVIRKNADLVKYAMKHGYVI